MKNMEDIILRLNSLSDERFGFNIDVRESDMEIIIQQLVQIKDREMIPQLQNLITEFKEITTIVLSSLVFSETDIKFGAIYSCDNPNLFRSNISKLVSIYEQFQHYIDQKIPITYTENKYYNQDGSEKQHNSYSVDNERAAKFKGGIIGGCIGIGLLLLAGINGTLDNWDGITWTVILGATIGSFLFGLYHSPE